MTTTRARLEQHDAPAEARCAARAPLSAPLASSEPSVLTDREPAETTAHAGAHATAERSLSSRLAACRSQATGTAASAGHRREGADGDRPRALILFAGPPERDDGLAAYLQLLGFDVVTIDTKEGGAAHDVTRAEVAAELRARVHAGEFDVLIAAPPCQSFSIAHRPRLRSAEHPEGLPTVPAEWRRYLLKHNLIAAFTFALADVAEEAGAMVIIENPAARSGPPIGAAAAYWHSKRDHGSMWHTGVARRTPRPAFTFAQCAFGAPVQKWTTIVASPAMAASLAGLHRRGCQHGAQRHPQQAHGRDEAGNARAERAAAYPRAMNAFLAAAAAHAVATRARAPERGGAGAVPPAEGGRIGDGATLTALVRDAIDAARHAPARFASTTSRVAASRAELRAAAMPGNLHRPMLPGKPGGRPLKRGRALPPDSCAASIAAGSLTWVEPSGRIAIEDLFLPGVYADVVDGWLREAAEAARLMRAGESAPRVRTRVLPQEAMQPFARGAVWDTRDRNDCRLVQRSTRSTVFPGARQLDRGALREMASDMVWADTDIIAQAGEGGIEARSSCPLTTVLAWHHGGIEQHHAVADGVIQAEMRDEWVSLPYGHPPFVPCRVLPRNVVQQQRTRLRAGALEHYLKPRITQDSSDGAEASVNGGVGDAEATVELPSVQQLGRGAAIIEEAGADAPAGERVHAEVYMVDATAAFRFCVMQRADWWTQTFFWWTTRPSGEVVMGVCIDTRMAFGGRYSPNRFERISRMVGAHVQREQARFDAAQPPPPHVLAWAGERRALQARGALPPGEGQAAPRYLQVFIDDWGGAALNDRVVPPAEVRGIDITPEATVVAGGRPAAPTSRARVHAQLTVAGLQRAGLEPAASKSLLGDRIIALGIRVDVAGRRLDTPPDKRATVLREVADARARADSTPPTVDVDGGQRLVGRLCNLTQVEPRLVSALHGGYAVVSGRWAQRAAGRAKGEMRLRRASRAWHGWKRLLDQAETIVTANEGVELASRAIFAPTEEPGTATSVTDASGWDGAGGYVFCADAPGEVWVVSEAWPADAKRALARAAAPRADRAGEPEPELAVAAAEAFVAWAVPLAARSAGAPWSRVISVVDCQPAAAALNRLTSGNGVMRAVAEATRDATHEWLACAIPRTSNLDADRLSHPSELGAVVADARAAGLRVHVVEGLGHEAWALLRRSLSHQGGGSGSESLEREACALGGIVGVQRGTPRVPSASRAAARAH